MRTVHVAHGRAEFVAGEAHVASAGTIVVVRDPSVKRRASALESGTTILAIGGKPDRRSRSSAAASPLRASPSRGLTASQTARCGSGSGPSPVQSERLRKLIAAGILRAGG